MNYDPDSSNVNPLWGNHDSDFSNVNPLWGDYDLTFKQITGNCDLNNATVNSPWGIMLWVLKVNLFWGITIWKLQM